VEFPNDDNGDVLRRLQEDGDDLSQPRDIDFTVVFPEETAAHAFADEIRLLGYRVEVERTGTAENLPWDARIVRNVVPAHEAISEFELRLEQAASQRGGCNDGWGCFSS
jgi:hypothetical protein